MSISKQYKEDLEGVFLMRTQFPAVTNGSALKRMIDSKKTIVKAAQKLYSNNYTLFQKVGLDRSDLESILMTNVYVLFSSQPESKENILSRFLRQRGLKLINLYSRFSEGIAESVLAEDSTELIESFSSNTNPEDIASAKETIIGLVVDAEYTLTDQAYPYLCKFFSKNHAVLVKKGYSFAHLEEMTKQTAEKYVKLVYQNNQETSYEKFHGILVRSMSRFISEVKEVNG